MMVVFCDWDECYNRDVLQQGVCAMMKGSVCVCVDSNEWVKDLLKDSRAVPSPI